LRELAALLRPLAALRVARGVDGPRYAAQSADGAGQAAPVEPPTGQRTSAAALVPGLAARALARLERDLLPRTAGAHEHLVVGIVGPNNAGKSALFNALVGAGELSPSRPVGGATRRLVGAVHPKLRARLEAEPTLARFPMRGVTPTREGVLEALQEAAVPAELLLIETTAVPEGLLLVDTPDFDSVLRTNREVAAALLQVADVAVAVVTRHTYQNRDVVEFLAEWLAHERPWVLVYNEAFDDATTRRHAEALARGVGAPPVALFAAAHSAAVARGDEPLRPCRVALESEALHAVGSDSSSHGDDLASWLRDQGEARTLKARALAASLAQLAEDLAALVGLLNEEAARADELEQLAARLATGLGQDVARATMPATAFLEAFRRVLDRRPTAFLQSLRGGLRWTGDQLSSGARWVGRRLGTSRAPSAQPTLAGNEVAALAAHWTSYHAALVRALRPARDAARDVDPELHAALAADLAAPAGEGLARLQVELLRSGAGDSAALADFARTCEGLIERELDQSSHEWALQLGVDALHLLPAVAAGAVILHTGGLGADVAVAGGGALSAVLAERLSRVLGSGVAHEARERWAVQRGATLGQAAERALLSATAPVLRRRALGARAAGQTIDAWLRGQTRDARGHLGVESTSDSTHAHKSTEPKA
jgi:hypothetical protein